MKILFIHLLTDKNERDIFPIGYACLMTHLERVGHETEIIFPRAFHLTLEDISRTLARTDADIVAMGGTYAELQRAALLSALIRSVRPDLRIVIGGPMVTYSPSLSMRKTGADWGVRGDGEIATVKLVDCIAAGKDPSDIPGLLHWQDGEVQDNGFAEKVDLADDHLPDWSKFPMHYYLHDLAFRNLEVRMEYPRSFSWVFSRGCIGRCNFCTPGGAPRFKKIDQMVDQLGEIKEVLNPTSLYFADNIIGPNEKYIVGLCEALLDNNIRFDYIFANLRADQVTRNTLLAMRAVGCRWLGIGLECANNEILDKMGKKITVEQAVDAIEIAKSVGIAPRVSIMFGQPGETIADFKRSIEIFNMSCDALEPTYTQHEICRLITYPGAPIYDYALENGYFKDDDAFYEDFFEKNNRGLVNYTQYSDRTVTQLIETSHALVDWNYCKSYKTHLESKIIGELQGSVEQTTSRVLAPETDYEPYIRNLLGLKSFASKRLLLCGVSDIAESILRLAPEYGVAVTGLADGYEQKFGQVVHGLTITPYSKIDLDAFDAVLLCTKSASSDNAILLRVRWIENYDKEIISVYSFLKSIQDYEDEKRRKAPCGEQAEYAAFLEDVVREML